MARVTEIRRKPALSGMLSDFELAVLDEQVRSRLTEAYREVTLWRHVRRAIEELKCRRDQERQPSAPPEAGL